MWKERIETICAECGFSSPATTTQTALVEKTLGVALPDELREVLLESNGVLDEFKDGVIWPVQKIVQENLMYRTYADFKQLYMPFDCLLLFGEEGGGDLYAYAITEAVVRQSSIYVWEHETDSRRFYAGRMQAYLEQRLASAQGPHSY